MSTNRTAPDELRIKYEEKPQNYNFSLKRRYDGGIKNRLLQELDKVLFKRLAYEVCNFVMETLCSCNCQTLTYCKYLFH